MENKLERMSINSSKELKKKKLIIGEFNDAYPPIMDGVGQVTKNYAYWVGKKLGKSYVITPSIPGRKFVKGEVPIIEYASLPIPGRKPYRYGFPWIDFKFQKELKKIKFDIIHTHCPFVSGSLGLKVAKKLKIPLITTFHTKYLEDFKSITSSKFILKILLKKMVKFYDSADFVWVPNKSTIQTLRDYGYKGKIEVIQNGTDLKTPKNLKPLRKKANNDFGTSDEEFVLMFIGQLKWEKNLGVLIKALEEIAKQKKEFKMIFIGEGHAEEEIKKMLEKKNLGKYVKFLGIVRDRELIKSYFSRANLFLFPSLYDTSPLTIREAAAFNLPTLFIKNSTGSEGIVDWENGFLSKNNHKDYAKKIIEIMENQKRLNYVGKGAHRDLYKTWEEVSKEVAKRYEEVIRAHKKK
ncbi:MAG: glycosyltransferase [Nanoarchaeota archaeon]|nr:glycosyltransferase [Nanoarchaeota archaeon]